MPARLAPWPRASRTTLVRCLWLAALLHLWAALWLGSAPEGTAPPGQGVQGRLNVTLRGPSDEGLPSLPQVAPQAGTAPAEATPRLGGRVRDTELPPDTAPGAARLGPAPRALAPSPALEAAPEAVPPPVAAPVAPPLQPPLAQLPVPEPLPRATLPPPPTPSPEAAPPSPPQPDPVLRALAADPLPARALPQPALVAPAVPTQATPRLPALAPLPTTPLAPAESRLEAGALRAVVPGRTAPLAPPAAASLPQLPPAGLPPLREAVAQPAPLPPAEAPAVPPGAPPSVATTPAPAVPAAARSPAASNEAPPSAPAPAAAPTADTGPRLGADVAVPATAASAPRPLNLELGRLRGGELSRLGAPGVLPVLPRPPETDKLAAEIEKTAREDCRKAHAGAGLLAVVPLAVDTLRGKGCKW